MIDSILPVDNGKTRIFRSVLQSIMELRQICNHGPDLLPPQALEKAITDDSSQERKQDDISSQESDCCGVCGCDLSSSEVDNIFEFTLPCLHILCRKCMTLGDPTAIITDAIVCPLCADILPNENFEDGESLDSRVSLEKYQPSSKVMALMENLKAYRLESIDGNTIKR